MKNWKGFFAGAATMLLTVALIGPAVAKTGTVTQELEYRDIQVTLDGEKLDLRNAKGDPVEPFMFGGTNYLPVRALAEALGLTVAWDGNTNTVVLTTPQEAETVPADELLFSKEHVRFYYAGYRENTDGSYEFDIRIENDSDYTLRIGTQDFTINSKKVPVAFNYTVKPGEELVCPASVSAEALEEAEISEVRRFSTMFVANEIVQDSVPVHFNTGVARVAIAE